MAYCLDTLSHGGDRISIKMREIFDNAPPRNIERRRGRDSKEKSALILLLVSWAAWATGFIFIHMASPEHRTLFDGVYNKMIRTSWRPENMYIALFVWAGGIIMGMARFILTRGRRRRKTDHTGVATVLSVVLNTLSIVLLVITMIVNEF